MEKNQQLYFNFPIMMIRGVWEGWKDKPDFLRDILYFHIENHAQKIEDLNEYEETDAQRFKRSAEFWNVSMSGDVSSRQERGAELLAAYEESKVFVGISTDVFWNYYKTQKSDFEWECLIAFLALKSIVGNKSYCKSNNALLFARISGNESSKDDHSLTLTEYHRNKIIFKLETEWNLKYYSRYTRGFYFGINVTLQELIFEAESKREKLKVEQLKNTKAEILKCYQNQKI